MKNTTIEKLELLTIPLQDINLIETSAGTGKTYTITTLVLRLILEKRLTIRSRLREVLQAFQKADTSFKNRNKGIYAHTKILWFYYVMIKLTNLAN